MAHFARVENGIVTDVLVVPNEFEDYGQEYLNDLGLEGVWIQTSYNNNIRKNYAGIGYTYDEERDAFIPPKPEVDCVFDEENCTWIIVEVES